MWWIILVILFVLLFLWLMAHGAARGIDKETQTIIDEEQTLAVEEYKKRKK